MTVTTNTTIMPRQVVHSKPIFIVWSLNISLSFRRRATLCGKFKNSFEQLIRWWTVAVVVNSGGRELVVVNSVWGRWCGVGDCVCVGGWGSWCWWTVVVVNCGHKERWRWSTVVTVNSGGEQHCHHMATIAPAFRGVVRGVEIRNSPSSFGCYMFFCLFQLERANFALKQSLQPCHTITAKKAHILTVSVEGGVTVGGHVSLQFLRARISWTQPASKGVSFRKDLIFLLYWKTAMQMRKKGTRKPSARSRKFLS